MKSRPDGSDPFNKLMLPRIVRLMQHALARAPSAAERDQVMNLIKVWRQKAVFPEVTLQVLELQLQAS